MKRHNIISSAMAFELDVLNTFSARQVYFRNSKFYRECMGTLATLPLENLKAFERQYVLKCN